MSKNPHEVERAVAGYTALLYRHCYLILNHSQDAQDTVQETFLRYMQKAPNFSDDEHEKAWLLAVATNLCRNQHRHRKRHPIFDCADRPEQGADIPLHPLLDALAQLPLIYRQALALHYVHGYKVWEIASMLHTTESAVKMRLKKGRELLKKAYKEE